MQAALIPLMQQNCIQSCVPLSLSPIYNHKSSQLLHSPIRSINQLSALRLDYLVKMHPPLTLHRHPMCAEIIEEFQKCHSDHPVRKFFGECTDLKVKLDRCFRQEKAVKRKANFEESKKLKERLQAYRKESAESS